VSLLDHSVLRAVGRYEVLHPSDPRPLLVLADLERNGPCTPGSIPALVDRSRSATHRLVRRMSAAGLVTNAAPRAVGRGPMVGITREGSAAFGSVLDALAEDLPALQPAIAAMARSLGGER
jgi:DNA-binding MarR family transcriptional regulator